MLKKPLLAGICTLIVGLSGNAYAAGGLEVTVLSLDEHVATVQANGSLPDWVQQGTTVQAAGWSSTIDALADNTFELHFQQGRTNVVKPDTNLIIRSAPQISDGLSCG